MKTQFLYSGHDMQMSLHSHSWNICLIIAQTELKFLLQSEFDNTREFKICRSLSWFPSNGGAYDGYLQFSCREGTFRESVQSSEVIDFIAVMKALHSSNSASTSNRMVANVLQNKKRSLDVD